MAWNLGDMPDLSGKVILVTGATSGIGLHATMQFAKRGAKLILASRNSQKMATVAAMIRDERPDADLELIRVDVSDLDSVREFAAEFKARGLNRIDVLLLNAGTAYGPYRTSKQGFELTFATNHLGHWLLTGLLIDAIKDVPGSRIIAVSSLAHNLVSSIKYDLARGSNPQRYLQFVTYSQTKLANQWFIAALNDKLAAANAKTIAVAAHPGCATTSIQEQFENQWTNWIIIRAFSPLVCQTAAQGAWPLLMAATDPKITRSSYYGPSTFFECWGPPISTARVNPIVKDEERARELWQVSEELTEYRYSI